MDVSSHASNFSGSAAEQIESKKRESAEEVRETDYPVDDVEKMTEERKVLKARRSTVLPLIQSQLETSQKALKTLTEQLEERIKCPVCLEVPTVGPVYSCPQGHLVCSICYQGPNSNCPICRTRMAKTISLLATTVIENIEHRCKFEEEGCKVKSSVGKVEEHRRQCPFRPVRCPETKICNKEVPLAHLVEHVLNSCQEALFKRSCVHVEGSTYARRYVDDTHKTLLDIFSWEDKFFFLCQRTEKVYRSLYVQMLGTEEECKLYKVSIALADTTGKARVSFSDCPVSIEMSEDDRRVAGFPIFNKMMNKLSSEDFYFFNHYTVELKFSHAEKN